MYTTSDIKDSLQAESTSKVRKWASALERRGVKIERIDNIRIFNDDIFLLLSRMKRISEDHPKMHLDKVSYLALNNLETEPEFIPEAIPQDREEEFVNMKYLKTIEKKLYAEINSLKNDVSGVEQAIFDLDTATGHRMNNIEKKHKKLDDFVSSRDQLLLNTIREIQEMKKPRKLSFKERWSGITEPFQMPIKGEV